MKITPGVFCTGFGNGNTLAFTTEIFESIRFKLLLNVVIFADAILYEFWTPLMLSNNLNANALVSYTVKFILSNILPGTNSCGA